MISVSVRSVGVFVVMVAGLLSASSLDIYHDGAKYRMIPADSYLGFSEGVTAVCEGQERALSHLGECPKNERLCKLQNDIQVLGTERNSLRYASEALEKLLSLVKPTQVDASKWIDAAAKIGKYKAELLRKRETLAQKFQAEQTHFSKQAPTSKALYLEKKCVGELELTIPAGMIGARLLYEADVSDPKAIVIKQYIALSNQSGIDMIAKEANLYAKSYRIYLKPQAFSPWIAHIAPELKRMKKNRAMQKAVYAEMAEDGGDIAAAAPVAHMGAVMRTGYKNYHIAGIELPSTGEEIKVKIADYTVPAKYELISYPYRDSQVYKACSFTPKTAIESHQWRIEKNRRLVSDQAYGTYRDGKYLLNVDVEDELLVERKPIVKRDKSSGIFGGTIHKKDGFELIVTNLSSESKTLKIIEHIPTSTTDKIKIKLLQVEGAEQHTLNQEGRLEITVILAPKAVQKIKVLFELRYDKDVKVRY